MIDEWSGLADMLANLIEKYASDLDIENLPNIVLSSTLGAPDLSYIRQIK